MACGPRTTGGAAILWFTIFGIIAVIASISYNYILADSQYASTPAKSWALIGGLTSNSVQFRIRLPVDDYEKHLIVSEAGAETTERISDIALTTTDHQSSHPIMNAYGLYAVDVTDLEPNTKYSYSLTSSAPTDSDSSLDTIQLKGTFHTPPTEGSRFSFKVAAASCAWTGSTASVFDQIRQSHPDLQLMLHLGDFHYENNNTTDLQQRLDAISTVLESNPQAELYRSLPLAYTWDDHDFLGNERPDLNPSTSTVTRDAARLSYQLAFPHYALAAAAAAASISTPHTSANTNNETSVSPLPIYHAFTIGTVRFIISDLMSESDGTSIYSDAQRDWLMQELQTADQYDYVVWASSKPWIGSGESAESEYGSWMSKEYQQDRSELSSFITDVLGGTDGPQNLIMVGGDAHMVAFDDGTNSYFGEEPLNGLNSTVNSFPILQSAPLDRMGSKSGGPYSGTCQAFDLERTHQYSTMSFEFPTENDGTSSPCLYIESFRVDEWYGQSLIFDQRICGKLFRPARSPEVSKDSCSIEVASTTSLAFYITCMVMCLLLGCVTFLVAMRDRNQSICGRVFCGITGTLLGWFFAALTFAAGIAMYYARNVNQYDAEITFLIGLAFLAVCCFAVFIIGSCCFKSKPSGEKKEVTGVDEYSYKPDDSSILHPAVIRQAISSTVSETELPEGVILHGGKQLHEAGLNGSGVRVAVIDSGVDKEHPGFNGKVTKQVWLRSCTPLEEDDHGTHVAGTIHMMAPQAEIYDYRVFGRAGDLGVDSAIAKSIRDATDEGCQVVNMSLGGPATNNTIWDAIQYAESRGVVLVCAAGNEGDNNPLSNEVSFPAAYKECISVGAVSKRNGFPVAVFSSSNPFVDYAGIGVDVVSFKPGGGFQIMSGTSMACPHVAGLIACLMTSGGNPASTIRNVLNGLAIDIDTIGIDTNTGIGFVTYLNESVFDDLLPRSAATARARCTINSGISSDMEQEVVFSRGPRGSVVSSLGSGIY